MLMKEKIKFACAPIAWTNDDMPDLGSENTFEQCISEMALAGYSGTEIGNKYPRNPQLLRDYLQLRNLEVASAWLSTYLTTKPFEETKQAFIEHRDFLHEMGASVIVISEQGHSIQGQLDTSIFSKKPIFTDVEWDLLFQGLEKLGRLAHEKDMEIVYHHHMGTGIQTTEEIKRLMDNTSQENVSLLYDTGHLVFSGEDPLIILKNYQSRIKHIHFKDVRAEVAQEVKRNHDSFLTGVKKGAFTVPGDGMIDFRPIMDEIIQSDYEGWIVVEAEQDPAKANPFEYALKARKYINELIK